MGSSGGRLDGRLPELLTSTVVLVAGLLGTAVGATAVTGFAAVLPPSAAGLADLLFQIVVVLGLVATLLVTAVTWLAVGKARDIYRWLVADKQVEWFQRASRLESLVPPLRRLGLSTWLRPDEEAAVDYLHDRYVEGEIDEYEFERELERLLGEDAADVQSLGLEDFSEREQSDDGQREVRRSELDREFDD